MDYWIKRYNVVALSGPGFFFLIRLFMGPNPETARVLEMLQTSTSLGCVPNWHMGDCLLSPPQRGIKKNQKKNTSDGGNMKHTLSRRFIKKGVLVVRKNKEMWVKWSWKQAEQYFCRSLQHIKTSQLISPCWDDDLKKEKKKKEAIEAILEDYSEQLRYFSRIIKRWDYTSHLRSCGLFFFFLSSFLHRLISHTLGVKSDPEPAQTAHILSISAENFPHKI